MVGIQKARLKTGKELKEMHRAGEIHLGGGDTGETVIISMPWGNKRPFDYKKDSSIHKRFESGDLGEEFLIVDHPNVITRQEYGCIKRLFDMEGKETMTLTGVPYWKVSTFYHEKDTVLYPIEGEVSKILICTKGHTSLNDAKGWFPAPMGFWRYPTSAEMQDINRTLTIALYKAVETLAPEDT